MPDHDVNLAVTDVSEVNTNPLVDGILQNEHDNAPGGIDKSAGRGTFDVDTHPIVNGVSHNDDDDNDSSSRDFPNSPGNVIEPGTHDHSLVINSSKKDDNPASDIDDGDSTDSDSPRGILCAHCSRLDLSASRFIIDSTPRHARNEVRNYYLRKSLPAAVPSSYSGLTTIRLGTLSEIHERAPKCDFCKLVKTGFSQEVQDAEEKNIEGNGTSAVDPVLTASWEIDGRARGRGDTMRSKTRRLHLKWSAGALGDAYVVFVPPHDYMRPSSDAPSVFKDDDLFLGRPIDSTGKNRALMKSWYDLCRDKHQGPCRSGMNQPEAFVDMVNSSFFGVIDAWNLQLTYLPCNNVGYEPYVALSYVWGEEERYRTLLNNVIRHRTPGGLETIMHKLPQAIQDAIALVPLLGLRYLWVDSLCIVQNSARSWKLNAFNMNLIYGHAALTICAADGQDSTEGLRAMHRKKRNAGQHTAEIAPGIQLMLTKPPESAIRRSTWASRAWTFQERLLSPRALIFVDGRVYFQCRSTGMSEDFVADKEGAGWSLDLVDAPLQILRQVDTKPLWVYMKAVELYTRRLLSHKEDILAAFSGTCRMLEARMSGPFVFGLPTSHFDLALLWQSERPATRRLIPEKEKVKLAESERDFPSWAWCGWEDSPMLYDSVFLDGVSRDTNAWLLKHTWITWNVRDGHGNLRPLWDKNVCRTNYTTEGRWRGYKTSTEVTEERKLKDYFDVRRSRVEIRLPQSERGSLQSFEEDANFVGNTKPQEYEYERDEVFYDDRIIESQDLFGRNFGDYVDSPSSFLVRDGKDRHFRRSLPEFPYRVVQKPYQSAAESIEHPLKPVLQFHTLYKRLNLVPVTEPVSAGSNSDLKRYSIADDSGDWCGSIVLDSSWFERQQSRSRLRREFIAISEAMRFSEKECATWTYYIPKEQEESEWDLFYVLLIQLKGDVWERIGVGKVFKEAFEGAKWEEIVLG